MNFATLVPYLPKLLSALNLTILLTVVTLVISTLLALPLAVLRDKPGPIGRVVTVFSWVTRTLPVLVILFMVFYGLPALGLYLPAVPVAVVALSVQCSGYNLEILRGGLRSVPKQQYDALRAAALPPVRGWFSIILRQAIPAASPAYFSNAVRILKATSIASVITVMEITAMTVNLLGVTYATLELLTISAVLYLTLSSVIIGSQMLIERKLALP